MEWLALKLEKVKNYAHSLSATRIPAILLYVNLASPFTKRKNALSKSSHYRDHKCAPSTSLSKEDQR